jgi:hypothetical protein
MNRILPFQVEMKMSEQPKQGSALAYLGIRFGSCEENWRPSLGQSEAAAPKLSLKKLSIIKLSDNMSI